MEEFSQNLKLTDDFLNLYTERILVGNGVVVDIKGIEDTLNKLTEVLNVFFE